MTDAYREDLAYIHDVGFGHLAKNAAQVLLNALRHSDIDKRTVIDLGCGSGLLASELAGGIPRDRRFLLLDAPLYRTWR